MPDIRPAPQALLMEIGQLQKDAANYFAIDLDQPPVRIVESVKEIVENIKANQQTLTDDQLAGLSTILAEQYVRQFDWHWSEVNFDDDYNDEHYFASVLIADNSLAIVPVWWVSSIIEGEQSNGILLNFNLVAANQVPVVDRDSALRLH